jgi:hypothetical protein
MNRNVAIFTRIQRDHFDAIAMSSESWFRYFDPCSKMFARSRAEVISSTCQTIGTKKNMITAFFTDRKRGVLDFLSKGSQMNHLYSRNYKLHFPDLKKANLNFRRQTPQFAFRVHIDNSICHHKSNRSRNSRSIAFHDCPTQSIRQTEACVSIGSWCVERNPQVLRV